MSQAVGIDRAGGTQGAATIVGRSPWELFWRRLRQDKFAMGGLVFIVLLIIIAAVCPLISRYVAHHGPNEGLVMQALDIYGVPKGPSSQYWFGADGSGRDLFVRVLYGARTSLIVAFFATGLEMVVGIVFGVAAGFYRGKIDTVISRVMDIVLSLPVLLLALGLVSACGLSNNGCLNGLIKPGLLLVSYVIGLFSWPYIARIVRGQVLSLREREFVQAARVMGMPTSRILFKELLPNLAAPIIISVSLMLPAFVAAEAGLAYLGIGVTDGISWGQTILKGTNLTFFREYPQYLWQPLLGIVALVLSLNLLGDAIRDALDPKTRR